MGMQTYRRNILKQPSGKGKKCVNLIKASKCNMQMCSKSPAEKAKKMQAKAKRVKIERVKARKVLYAKQEKSVVAAQNKSAQALWAALKDPNTGHKNHNDWNHVNLVDSVNKEIKTYHDDDMKRSEFEEKHTKVKKELFEKSMVEAVTRMKSHMGKAK